MNHREPTWLCWRYAHVSVDKLLTATDLNFSQICEAARPNSDREIAALPNLLIRFCLNATPTVSTTSLVCLWISEGSTGCFLPGVATPVKRNYR